MYIIIIGCGRIGSMLANQLIHLGHHVVVIDHEKEKLEVFGSGFNGLRLHGIEYDLEVLESAGIREADLLFAMTPDDNTNLVVAQVAQHLYQVPRVIGRISDPEKQYLYDQLQIESFCPASLSVGICHEIVKQSE